MPDFPDTTSDALQTLLGTCGLQALQSPYGELARLLASTDDMIFVKDNNGVYLMVNAAFARYFSSTPEGLIGCTMTVLGPPELLAPFAQTDDLVLKTGISISYEMENLNGHTPGATFHCIKGPVRDASDRITGVVGILRNVSSRKRTEEALRLSESRLAAAQAIAHLGSWEWNLKTNEVIWSAESYRIYGVEPEAFVPAYVRIEKMIHPGDLDRFRKSLRASAHTGTSFSDEIRIVRPSGEERHLLIEGVVTRYDMEGHEADGAPLIMTGTHLDITERKRAELAVRRSESMFRHAQSVAGVGSWLWEPATGSVTLSDQALRVLGIENDAPTEMSLEGFLQLVHPADREQLGAAIEATLQEDRPYDFVYRLLLEDGEVRLIHSRGAMQHDNGNSPVMTGVCHDITESERIRKELAASRDEARDLMHNLQNVQEVERRRIAREIHDEFGAVFTAANISLYRLSQQLAEAPPAVRELLAGTKEILANAGHSLDDIVNGLHPQMLNHLGLAATVEWYAREFAKRAGIEVRLNLPPAAEEISEEQSIALFRCLQESLTNVARHAAASRVSVTLCVAPEAYRLSIADDGKGVDQERLGAAEAFGIRGMHARVAQLGGHLQLSAEAPRGTRVTCVLPRPAVSHTPQQGESP